MRWIRQGVRITEPKCLVHNGIWLGITHWTDDFQQFHRKPPLFLRDIVWKGEEKAFLQFVIEMVFGFSHTQIPDAVSEAKKKKN